MQTFIHHKQQSIFVPLSLTLKAVQKKGDKRRKLFDSLQPASPAPLIALELGSKFNKGVLSPRLISGITIAESPAGERDSTEHE